MAFRPAARYPFPSRTSTVRLAALLVATVLLVWGHAEAVGSDAVPLPLVAVHEVGGPVFSLDFDPANPLQMLVATKTRVHIMGTLSGKDVLGLATASEHYRPREIWLYSPCGGKLAATGSGPGVLLCDARSGEALWVFDTPFVYDRYGFGSVAFTPDGRFVAAANSGLWGSGFHVWDVTHRVLVGAVDSPFWTVMTIAISPDDAFLAATTWGDGGVHLWDTESWTYLRPVYITGERNAYRGDTNRVWSCATFSPDSDYLAVGSTQGDVLLFHLPTGHLHSLGGQTGGIAGFVFSPDGRYLVSASLDGSVRFWRTDSGTLEWTLFPDGDRVTSLASSADGTFLAIGTGEGRVHIYAFADLGVPQLSPTVLASQTYVDIDRDSALEVIEIYLTEGTFSDDTSGWCGGGLKWAGEFDIRVRRGGTVLSVQSLETILGWPGTFFRPPQFALLFWDYNGDGQLDFALARYAGCNGSYIRLLTVAPSGEVRSLAPQEFYVASLENGRPNQICVREGMVGFTSYHMPPGLSMTKWYRWDGPELVYVETTVPFCKPLPER